MALATLDDVAALGGVPTNFSGVSPEGIRATRLLELASGSVLALLDRYGVSEANVAGWEPFRRDALAGIVAEVAAKRLNVSAAPNVEPYGTAVGTQTIKLNRWEQDAIRDLLPGGGLNTSMSIEVERDASWLDLVYGDCDEDDDE